METLVEMKQEKFNSGVSSNTNLSYESYLKAGLDNISPNLSVRVYKLAPKMDYPFFERGKDLRVQIFWNKETKHEFIVERIFFYQSNRNKDDRAWMRTHADVRLKMFKDAVRKKKKKKKIKKIGSTQEAFEKMKSK